MNMSDTQKEVIMEDFIKWLQQFPSDTTVRVAVQEPSRGYESYGPVKFMPPDLHPLSTNWISDQGDGWDYTDWGKMKNPIKEGQTLYLGESC